MKKRLLIFSIILVLTIGIIYTWFVSYEGVMAKRPFRSLKSNDILSIRLLVILPGSTIFIEDNERIKEIVYILNKVVIYEKPITGLSVAGQVVQFTILMKDGTTLKIGDYNPYININEKMYKTKYEPCEDLNRIGNMLINNK